MNFIFDKKKFFSFVDRRLMDSDNNNKDSKLKKYDNITNETRQHLIEIVSNKQGTIKAAAEKLGIKFSTAKVILQTYRREGRIGKKKTRQKKGKKTQVKINENEIHNTRESPIKIQKDPEYKLEPQLTENVVQWVPQVHENAQNLTPQQLYVPPRFTSESEIIQNLRKELLHQQYLNQYLLQIVQQKSMNGQAQVYSQQQIPNYPAFKTMSQNPIPDIINPEDQYLHIPNSLDNLERELGFQSPSFTNLEQRRTWRDVQWETN